MISSNRNPFALSLSNGRSSFVHRLKRRGKCFDKLSTNGFFGFLVLLAVALAAPAHAERVRDLGQFQGVRSNQLTGYGVVVGLPGTGDDNLEYLTQAMKG